MSRDYVFTSWKQPEPDNDKLKYICWGTEKCPTTDRIHYQGFIIFNRTHRIPGAKRIIGGGDDAHLEPRRGTRQEARDYCRKDGEFSEFGQFDALTQKELFKQPIGILKNEYPEFFCRYYKGLYQLQDKGEKWRDVKVIIYWGETGTNKTRQCMEQEDIYKLDPPYKWYDGYMGERNILLDDYKRGQIDRGQLLNICDGYRLRLETKGGHVWANWTSVYITTNYDPEEWMDDALQRRVTKIVHTTMTCDQ